MRKFRILALDGGGVRGLLTARILSRLANDYGIDNVFDSVDLIAGTSSGGLIALAMAHGLAPEGRPHPPMAVTLRGLERIFDDAEDTFGPGLPWWLGGTLLWPKYGTEWRARAFKKAVGASTTLAQLPYNVLVPAFDLDNESATDGERDSRKWKPKLFHNLEGHCSDRNAKVWEVALYTTALPAYFPTVDGFIDGGVYANNPAMCALAQALDTRYTPRGAERPAMNEIVMLSIGSGQNLKFIPGQTRRWGVFRWGVKYVDLTVDGSVGIADFQCARLLGDARYRRIAPELPAGKAVGSDDLGKIEQLREFAEGVSLDAHAEWLKRHWMEGLASPVRRAIPRTPATSKHVLAATEITCLAPIRDGFVGVLDTRTYATRLRIVVRVLQALRTASRESQSLKAVADAVDAIRAIRSFQFAILGERQLLLTVTFTGAWEPYMRIIWRDLGPLMDLILCNCADYDGHSSDKGFEAFVQFIRSVQVDSEFFYPASGLSVDDERYLEELEALVRRGARDLDVQAAALTVSDPFTTSLHLARANAIDAARQAHAVLAVMAQLRDLYPTDPDRAFLERSTLALLRGSILIEHIAAIMAGGAALTPDQAWFKSLLDREAQADAERRQQEARCKPAPRDRGPADVVQAGILKPYKRREGQAAAPATHGCLLLARIVDARKARGFLAAWKDKLTVDRVGDGGQAGDGPFRNIAFTFKGLKHLGAADGDLDQFPKEFREGMEERAGLLGDVRSNHPQQWVLPEWNVPTPGFQWEGEVPRVRMSTIDLVVQLRIVAPGKPYEWTGDHPLWDEFHDFCRDARDGGIVVLSRQLMRTILAGGRVTDHFGFVDGISQPGIDRGRDAVALGELLLGYENDRRDPAFPEAKDAARGSLARRGSILDNGTFLVIRKLEQHVDRLDAILAANASPDTPPAEVKARMLGRRVDGKPLADTVTHGGVHQNDFDYSVDPPGDGCPLHAHIRRANPRTVATIGGKTVKTPRLVRRGMSYDSACEGRDGAERERGMMFMAYNASIAEQFEVIQRWITGGNSTGVFSGHRDPLLGVPDPAQPPIFRYTVTRVPGLPEVKRIDLGPEPFVTLKWGMYLFVPSLAAIEALTDEPVAGAGKEQAFARLEIGRTTMLRLQTADDWATVLEDTSANHSGLTAAVCAAIRAFDGGVRRTPYGVVVASEPLVMKVLSDDRRFSVEEYRNRMRVSIGEIYLGLDAGDEYQARSHRPNAAIQRITAQKAFDEAVRSTTASLMGLVRNGPAPVQFSLDALADDALARLSRHWLDIPDGQDIIAGGRPLPGETKPRCPIGTIPPSRYIFSSPEPRPEVAGLGIKSGQQLLDGVRRFVERQYAEPGGPRLEGELSRALFAAVEDREELARNLVGVLEGFLPTVFGNFMKVMHLWLTEETLWRLQQDLAIRADDSTFQHARAVLEGPLQEAMMRRPIPDLLYRTATMATVLGGVTIREGDRVVLSLASATQDLLAAGRVSVEPVFGGLRRNRLHPTHACPGYDMAMGVLLGMIAAVLQAGSLFPGTTQASLRLGDPRPFRVRAALGAV